MPFAYAWVGQGGAVEPVVSGVADGDGDAARPRRGRFGVPAQPDRDAAGSALQPWPMLWPLSDAQEALADPAVPNAVTASPNATALSSTPPVSLALGIALMTVLL